MDHTNLRILVEEVHMGYETDGTEILGSVYRIEKTDRDGAIHRSEEVFFSPSDARKAFRTGEYFSGKPIHYQLVGAVSGSDADRDYHELQQEEHAWGMDL